jgi:ribosomal protein S18 acetylase RimI-like enzyme
VQHFELRRLRSSDAALFRELRLEALERHPEAFGASWEDEQRQPESRFAERLEAGHVMGGFTEEQTLCGIVGTAQCQGQKTRHIASIWGMYVRPAARGRGLGRSLLHAVIEAAHPPLKSLRLSVEANNHPAIRLYEAAGFTRWALEIEALKVADVFHDEILMRLEIDEVGHANNGGPGGTRTPNQAVMSRRL